MLVYHSITQLVGKTPIMKIGNHNIFAKLEYFNPLGSIKDRVALAIVEDAERRGAITTGGTIIEATSGNTGIGLAFVAAARGYKLILTMPESMSVERRKLLHALGAEIILTPAKEGMSGSVKQAERMHAETPNSFMAKQFENPANPKIHYMTTGAEIYADMDGKVDVFVSGIGTGGTFSGTTAYLKEKKPTLYAVAVEPYDSPVLQKGIVGSHKIQGIGANFVPANLDRSLIDEIVGVKYEDAAQTANELAKKYGLLVGISSGAAMYVSRCLSERPEFREKNIVCILPDSGERYMSTNVFD